MLGNRITYLDLFSGTGAFAKGLLDAGFEFEDHYFSEIDKYAIANYRFNFKNAKNLGDVTKIQTKQIKGIDLVTFGSPCQDISVAGKRRGIKGSRSSLFFRAVEILDWLRPKVFVFENVKGLLFSNRGKDFERVLKEIANLGLYECQWQLIDTSWFLPQNRERIFVVGYLTKVGSPRIFPLLQDYSITKDKGPRILIQARSNNGQSGQIFSDQGITPTLTANYDGVGHIMIGSQIRKLTPIEWERLQGLPDDWTRWGNFDGEIKGISNHKRYTLLGNAITSSVMKEIGERLLGSRISLKGLGQVSKAKSLIQKLKRLNRK